MSQINSNTKDDFQVVLLLSYFVGHPVFIPQARGQLGMSLRLIASMREVVFCRELTEF